MKEFLEGILGLLLILFVIFVVVPVAKAVWAGLPVAWMILKMLAVAGAVCVVVMFVYSLLSESGELRESIGEWLSGVWGSWTRAGRRARRQRAAGFGSGRSQGAGRTRGRIQIFTPRCFNTREVESPWVPACRVCGARHEEGGPHEA